MRFVRYVNRGNPQWGVETDDGIISIASLPVERPTLETFTNKSYRRSVRRAVNGNEGEPTAIEDVSLLAPVPDPGKIICVGMNYRDHAEEQDEPIPEKPLLFAKAPTAVTNPHDPIVHPNRIEQVDYEVELGVIIGRHASGVDKDEVEDYVAGYTVVNDVSARDAQFDDGQFFRGKSYDTFAPMGPILRGVDAFDPNAVGVELRVNGDVKQRSNTQEFVFDVGDLVEYISGVMTLRPGDVISTGTPGGVGIFRDPPELLAPGDRVVAEIEGIGELENPVITSPTE